MLSVEPSVDPTAKLHDTKLGAYCEVGPRTILHEVAMDDYSYVVNDAQITYTTIGKFCSIAAMTRINPGNHPMHRASQAHFTYRASAYFPGESDEEEFFAWRRSHAVSIGHDVWIGHGAILLPGRSIGTGAVIAAGAIVTKDVPAYTIAAGNPARPIRRRFPESIAGRSIGTGAVIAAGAIVTKDVPAYTIVGGNPARPIKRRFPESIAGRSIGTGAVIAAGAIVTKDVPAYTIVGGN